MPNSNRRKVLKGITLTGVAAIAPANLLAAELTNANTPLAMYIDPRHGQFKKSLSNEIINTSNQALVLKTKEPVGYKSSNGRTVTLYIKSPLESQLLQPGERLPVYARI